MGRSKIDISKKLLEELYWEKSLSTIKIGALLETNHATIRNRLIEHCIPIKNPSLARNKYPKHDFRGTNTDKSYMIGFRLGDLNCYQTSERSDFIIARCHTTEINQVKVMKKLFSNYGKVTVSERDNHFHVQVSLNKTFEFLLPKKFAPKDLHLPSFTAGYFEAEGSFGMNQNKARFKCDSYDYEILKWISNGLSISGIENKFYRIGINNEDRSDGTKYNDDLWRIQVNRASEIEKLIYLIQPYMIHNKYQLNAANCLRNIAERRSRKTIK